MKEEEKNKEKANEQEQQKKELRAMDEYNEWMRNKVSGACVQCY